MTDGSRRSPPRATTTNKVSVKYSNVDRTSNVYAFERVPIFRTGATNADFVDRLRYTSNMTQYGWTRN